MIIEYLNTRSNKTFNRRIKFKNASKIILDKNPESISTRIIEKNPDILSMENVCFEQIVDLIKLLLFTSGDGDESFDDSTDNLGFLNVEKSKISTMQPTLVNSCESFKSITDLSALSKKIIFEDLNKVSEEENKLAKNLMNIEFEKNRLNTADEAFQYDKRVDFATTEEDNEWDEDDDED